MLLYRILLICTLLLSSIIPCQAATLSVGPGDSIQAAVATAKPGDIIEVESGTYYEHIKVDKPLILRGLEMPVLDATASGSAIVLEADGITVVGFRIINAGSWPKVDSKSAGIVVLSDGNRITGNDVSNNFNGLLVLGSNNTIVGNRVARNLGFGIRLVGAENNTIQENRLEENGQNAYDDGANLWEGNYYSDFNASEKECRDEGGDGLCDFSHAILGGRSIDLFPFGL
ncbi:MAG TPA: NosD domain-containing protein [Methanotrichaceae archaeon]|nr:NosD domain-containing protein [Methanotrichaceae archaeon]